MSSIDKKHIVIVGGGYFGLTTLHDLLSSPSFPSSKFSLTLITSRTFMQHNPSSIRNYISPTASETFEKNALITYEEALGAIQAKTKTKNGAATFKLGKVVHADLDKKLIRLEDGEVIGYDIIVFATGSRWEGALKFPEGPNSTEETRRWLRMWRERIKDAESVAIIGGGAVGIGTRFRWRMTFLRSA